MILTIFQPAFITLVLSLPSIINSSCYGTEVNGRTTACIYFFINIDFHNIILQKNEAKDQLCLLDFHNKNIIGRLSSATSSGLSLNTSFVLRLSFRTLAQYRATLYFTYYQVYSWRVSRLSSLTTAIPIAWSTLFFNSRRLDVV